MAVALSEADVAKLGPAARAQVSTATPPSPGGEPKAPTPGDAASPGRTSSGGARGGTKRAAHITRRAFTASGSGRPGSTTIRGAIWAFVWLGVLFYLVGNPATLPRIVHLIFAPVGGVLAVARGAAVVAPK